MPDNELTQEPLARVRLVGPRWTKRADRALTGIGGERASAGVIAAGVIGTQDRDSTSGLLYESPPGVGDAADRRLSGLGSQRSVINERSMRLTASALAQ